MGKQALPGSRKDVIFMDPFVPQIVGLDTPDGPEHPLYDDRIHLPIDEGLVLSIMYQGVLEPISVRKDGDVPQVVFGRQRVRAAREACKRLKKQGKKPVQIPALNRRGSDKDVLGVAISENENRRDDRPLSKARKVQKFLNLGATEDEAAIVMGVSKKSIQNWLRLLDCDDQVQKAVEDGKIAASAAMKLSSLPRKDQVEQLGAMVEAGKATTKQAAAIARSKTKPNGDSSNGASKAEAPEPDDDVIVAPSKRTLNRILQMVESGDIELDANAVKMLKWVNGEIGPQSIKGLTKGLNTIEAEAEAKRQAKAEREAAKRETKREAEGKKKAPPPSGGEVGGG